MNHNHKPQHRTEPQTTNQAQTPNMKYRSNHYLPNSSSSSLLRLKNSPLHTIKSMHSARSHLQLFCLALLFIQAKCFLSPTIPLRLASSSRLFAEEPTVTTSSRRSSSRSRARRPPPSERPRERSPTRTVERRRAPHQFDHTKAEARPFVDDPAAIIKSQSHNEDAPTYEFEGTDEKQSTLIQQGSHLIFKSLDELFPNLQFSDKFCSDGEFRNSLRNAMREDIFNSTPAYANLSEKAKKMLLLPDSSLQGSWKCGEGDDLRMKKLTEVLKSNLGDAAPTGDEFLNTIGSLCGSKPSLHWIDIVGIVERCIPHSWHQDTGRSPNGDTYTVMLGFPKEDNYDGVGVYSHAVKLKYEKIACDDHPDNEPVVYPGLAIDEKYIVRPRFAEGREICLFRDIDCIHSSPDVAFRASVMRFM